MTGQHDPLDPQPTEADLARVGVERRKEVDDLKWLMGHTQGRRIMVRILDRAGIRRTPFHTNGSTMAFNAGQQNIGLWLESEVLEASPEAYFKMLKEFTR